VTPLARQITRELTLPLKRRTFDDRAGLLSRMDDIHCFECTDAMPLARMLELQIPEYGTDERSTFLPAPKTWLEWQSNGWREGILLEQNAAGTIAKKFYAHREGSIPGGDLPLAYSGVGSDAEPERIAARERLLKFLKAVPWDGRNEQVLALLSIINTPRIVGRLQHMPHRGFERDVLRTMKSVGKFPLHAWTEIRLEITPPSDRAGQPSTEAHLTGQRALHFCRAHLRISQGRLQVVRSHWRGDPALGIKQSRYRLETSK